LIQAFGNSIYKSTSQSVGESTDVQDLTEDLLGAQNKLRHPFVSAKHLGINLSVLVINLNFAHQPVDLKLILINPKLLGIKAPLISMLEDDLSIPGLAVSIERPKEIELSYFDENWESQTKVFSDLSARWIMHGLDQLNGIAITDKLNKHRKRSITMHLKKISERKIEPNYKLEYEN
jgi:peptide deformylase